MNRLLPMIVPLFLLLTANASAVRSTAADQTPTEQTVEARLIADLKAVVPGQSLQIAVELVIPPGWHVYYLEPGDSGKPTSVQWTLPDQFQASDLRWQPPTKFEEQGLKTFGYQNQTLIVATVQVPQSIKPGQTVTIKATVSWLACKDQCVPGSAEVTLELPVAAVSEASNEATQIAGVNFQGPPEGNGVVLPPPQSPAPQPAGVGFLALLLQLLFAFVGGVILNLMPCVLPVVSLKVLSFARQGGEDRKQIVRLGLAYAAGTMATFLTLALIILAVRLAGGSVGWGFQFQQPWFVMAMASVLALMSASLFGAFDITVYTSQSVGNLASGKGLSGAFFTGVLATMLSTPCTAPFLGSAIGFALMQPAWVVLAIFGSIGFGLSAPYLLLTWKPVWLKFVPKPGYWMVRFKELMGFPMLLTAAWLLSVLGKQAGIQAAFAAMVWIIALVFAAWMTQTVVTPLTSRPQTWALRLVALIVLGAAGFFSIPAVFSPEHTEAAAPRQVNGVTWEKFNEAAMRRHLQNGKVVVIDFTADWCLTCKVNERILRSQDVAAAMRANNVVVMQGDWTSGDPEITAWLNHFGRSGVPLYVVLSPHRPGQPQVMPEILSSSSLIQSIEAASKP